MRWLQTVAVLFEMIKISHSVFALPFAVLGAFLACRDRPLGRPELGELTLIVAAMVSARSAAMAFNRLVDARYDADNPRTANRHIPAGRISRGAAWTFTGVCVAAFLGVCALFQWVYQNPWPAYLAPFVLFWLLGYSLAKRFTAATHFWLGGAIGAAPIAATIALRGSEEHIGITPESLILSVAVLFWTAGFDLIYACQDIEHDRRNRLNSIPAWIGMRSALWLARACHLLAVIALLGLGVQAGLGWLYAVGTALTVLLLIYEHSLVGDLRLARPDLSCVDLAFFTVNGAVSLIVGALAVLDVLLLSETAT